MYQNVLIGQDINKILSTTNAQRLLLIDENGCVEKYKQVAVAKYQDKILCVLRKKDDYTFGEVYIVESSESGERLVKESDINAVRYLERLYFCYLQSQCKSN